MPRFTIQADDSDIYVAIDPAPGDTSPINGPLAAGQTYSIEAGSQASADAVSITVMTAAEAKARGLIP